MKFLKGLLATLFIVIILGGLGYIGYSYIYMGSMNHQGMNTAPNAQANPAATAAPGSNQQGNQHQGQTSAGNTQTTAGLSIIATQNRDRLNQALNAINSAMDLITIDPYSKVTLPTPNLSMGDNIQGQTVGPGVVNIYPNGNTSVNVTPNGTAAAPVATPTPMPQMNQAPNQSYVYDQSKLKDLHQGIYNIAQGIALINQLNDDLLAQTGIVEGNPTDYQTYVLRYNLIQQNKAKLTKAMTLLSSAATLTNVNPYASPDGYPYDPDDMSNLHQGVYKLAQGMAILNDLNDTFTLQMAQATNQAQMIVNNVYAASSMTHSTGLFGSLNMTTVFNLILILMVIGLIGGIIGAIFSLFRRSRVRQSNLETDTNSF